MSDSPELDERPIEQGLRDILEPLDRQLARVTVLFPLAIVTIVPVVFFTLWLVHDYTGKRALVVAGGSCFGLAALYMGWDLLAARLALRRFDRRFPPGTPARGLALRILAEMETPSKAEEKLRVALANTSPDRIVRHRRDFSTTEPDTALNLPSTLAEPLAPEPQQIKIGSPTPTTNSPRACRPGGYYDYIPLEPRTGDQPAERDERK